MNRLNSIKRILTVLVLCLTAAAFSSAAERLPVHAENAEEESTESTDDTAAEEDVYESRLSEIGDRQAILEEQMKAADDGMKSEQEKQMLVLEEISILNEKTEVINSYLTEMEMKLSAERRNAQALSEEIDEGIAAYKLRLRALYLAGDMSYGDVLLGSGDFFDMLMRSELLKRVTDYDAKALDSLVAKKAEYDAKLIDLQKQEGKYDDQILALSMERKRLAELYDSSAETKAMLKDKMEKLESDERKFENEVFSYEGILSDLLKGTYISEVDEAQRLVTEREVTVVLEQLHNSIKTKEQAGIEIPKSECRYDFKWPVAGHTYVSSGVGARWGSYHTGLDIPGESGFPITASEAGEVVRTNNSCTHNYGKDGSCGCGGGYGNFIIIDHGNGFLTLYGHLTQGLVKVGDKVERGQQIGLMGSTGYSTGTHLHFELRYNGYITNPANFVTF
ncbi:Peptidase family M23 [Ruminococcus sp. YE71]|uniref:murein hydrolase activator EnvC family protein n=1 Tax=unclassified Ruminococcus TaxID=2608920 RepID=UPI0008825A4F|nr:MULTISPECIES: M23 family metallopeptidase [unclassified Ruminococcus]SDA27671.1 Peptidase family M23 [Ruminococcus sp. YE78]SFW45884.1 Peptidase family M23 [Ruminococcus sp. YE71]